MPTAITLASPAAFTSPIFKPLPPIPNTTLWAYFGGSLAQCVNNGNGGALQVGLGTVNYAANYVSFHGSAGSLQLLNQSPTATQTWMGVARYTAGGTGGASGSLISPASGQAQPILSVTNTTFQVQSTGITSPTSLTLVGGNNFKFLAYTSLPGGPHTLWNLTDNTNQVAAATGTSAVTPNIPVGFGGIPSGAGANDRGVDMAFVCWAQTLLAKATIDQVYAHVKDVMAGKGITI